MTNFLSWAVLPHLYRKILDLRAFYELPQLFDLCLFLFIRTYPGYLFSTILSIPYYLLYKSIILSYTLLTFLFISFFNPFLPLFFFPFPSLFSLIFIPCSKSVYFQKTAIFSLLQNFLFYFFISKPATTKKYYF